MSKMKVFVRKDLTGLYSNRGLKEPILRSYVYEYEAEDEVVTYWNLLNPKAQNMLLDEAQMKKMDLRRLIKEKQRERVKKTS
jgi:hypothetical protein